MVRVGLTVAYRSCIIDEVSTSLGEAATRIQATDLERRKTPRVRTALPGLRVEPKWLPASIQPDTLCGAEVLWRVVRCFVLFAKRSPVCSAWRPRVPRP